MEIHPQHRDLILTNNQQFLGDISQNATKVLTLIEHSLSSLQGSPNSLNLIYRLLINRRNQGLILEIYQGLVAGLIR